MATKSREARLWWQMRGLDKDRSLLFFVVAVIEEDEPGLYGATILGLEDRFSAMGASSRDAETHVLEMFRDLVDASIEDKKPLSAALPSFPFKSLPCGMDNADAIFSAIEKVMDGTELETGSDWRVVPTSPTFPVPAALLATAAA